MDPVEQELIAGMVQRQKTLAMLGWIAAVAIFVSFGVLYVTVAPSIYLVFAGLAVSGGVAAGARAASRRARLIAQGEDTSDLDLDF